ncbi:MAG: hypothetical protein V3V84_07825 [Candidatus Bathyarchaeia archaeon]
MTAFDQMQEMKEDLFNDLNKTLDKHRVHVGAGLLETDVVGILEKVKFDYMYENNEADTQHINNSK